tara:strand:- start:4465 stop:5235 length:771 start_codon:yes stop_codon:yes gene_type:complete
MIDRNQLAEEMKLREEIRRAIKIVKERRQTKEQKSLTEEKELRSLIRKLIVEAEVADEVPQRSTGINVLEDLLKKIVPILEDDFKQLTTDEEQRDSYRGHIVNGIQNLIAPEKAIDDNETEDLTELDVEIGDEDDESFIDIRSDAEKKSDEEGSPDTDLEKFGITGVDETGRNMAYQTFKKIENNILNAYDLLSNNTDRTEFYDYLITNVKLYFDKFEEDLKPNLDPEITTPEYEEEKASELDADDAGIDAEEELF